MPRQSTVAVDSTIFADGFELTPQHRSAWLDETKRIRALRGDILIATTELECLIDHALCDLVLPFRRSSHSPQWLRERHNVLQVEVLAHLTLRSKSEILCSLMTRRFSRQASATSELGSVLKRVRDVRNAMAHCPVMFQALRRPSRGRWLRTHLMTSRGPVTLSDGYVQSFQADISHASDLISHIMRKGLHVRDPHVERI